MVYMGSKRRIAKDILPIILKGRKEGQYYVEPFCGGCNLIDKVEGPRIANDNNYFLIRLFVALQNGWIPLSELTREQYKDIKENQESYPPELVGFAGFPCSFGGKWFGGYCKPNAKRQNYILEAHNSLLKQIEHLKDCGFSCGDYFDMYIPENSIIYCDPPYSATTGYKMDFNSDIFWNWVREKSKTNKVFVSEYNAPSDFECIWEKEIPCTLNKNAQDKRIEKLWVYNG